MSRFTIEEMAEIKKELDDRYVLQSSCDDIQKSVNKKFANDDKRIELGLHDFAVIKKLMWVVASTGIGSLVTAVFNLITK